MPQQFLNSPNVRTPPTGDECRTSNIQLRTSNSRLAGLALPLLRGLNAADEYSEEFVGLLCQRVHQPRPHERHTLDQQPPAVRLTQFLQANLELVHEIVGRLGGLRLPVIRQRRRARPQKLAGNVVACSRGGKSLHQPDNPRGILQYRLKAGYNLLALVLKATHTGTGEADSRQKRLSW